MKILYCTMCFLLIISCRRNENVFYISGTDNTKNIENNDNVKITTREHFQKVQIAGFQLDYMEWAEENPPNERNFYIYENPSFDSDIKYKLSFGDYFTISQIYRFDNLEMNTIALWLKITNENDISGYIYYKQYDPFDNNNGITLEYIEIKNKLWTVKKYEESMSVYDKILHIRDSPGLEGNLVLFDLDFRKTLSYVNIISITEEEETIGNKTDRWVKIIDEQGREGWIFGGYVDAERGGPKYLTPENIIGADYYMGNFYEEL